MSRVIRFAKQHAAGFILMLGLASAVNGGWIQLKAILSQWLIAHSWQLALQHKHSVKPWPWADTYAVARLIAEKQDVDLIVLDGIHGEALAFGPGMIQLGEGDSRLIAGHRDTHFGWLNQLQLGDTIRLQTDTTGWQTYRVEQQQVADSRNQALSPNQDLLLTTCYPFDALHPGGPLRYLVSLSRLSE